jgi:hypothetical protein
MLRSRLVEILNVPQWKTSCLGSLGWVGEKSYASGFNSPAALLDGLFEQPAVMLFPDTTRAELRGFTVSK